jgi:hypothetical protein
MPPPAPPDDSASGGAPPEPSLDEIVQNYQIELCCTKCQTRFERSIGFIRERATTTCPACRALVLLDISVIRQEIRHVENQLRQLRAQLDAALKAQTQADTDAEPLPPLDDPE